MIALERRVRTAEATTAKAKVRGELSCKGKGASASGGLPKGGSLRRRRRRRTQEDISLRNWMMKKEEEQQLKAFFFTRHPHTLHTYNTTATATPAPAAAAARWPRLLPRYWPRASPSNT